MKLRNIMRIIAGIALTIILIVSSWDYISVLGMNLYYSYWVDQNSSPILIARKIEWESKLDHPIDNRLNLDPAYCFQERDYGLFKYWINQTLQETKEEADPALIIDKAAKKLFLVDEGIIVRSFDVIVGENRYTDKYLPGDGATPEGLFRITDLIGGKPNSTSVVFILDYPQEIHEDELKVHIYKGLVPSGTVQKEPFVISVDSRTDSDGNIEMSHADISTLYEEGIGVGIGVAIVRYGMLEKY